MILVKTATSIYCITSSSGIKHFIEGYTPKGNILHMSSPKKGARLTVKYTPSGKEEDWEIHVSSPILEVTSSDDIN